MVQIEQYVMEYAIVWTINGVNVCELYFVCQIALKIILFPI